jgi:uncharacterized protein YgiB involved in biofilm formation
MANENAGTLMPNMIEGRKKSQFMNLSSMEHSGIANSYYPGYEEDREDMLRECSELMKSEMLYHSNSKSSKHSGLSISKEDFEPIKVIGRGGFGKVYMVKKCSSGTVYAMKVLCKDQIAQKNLSLKTQGKCQI